MRQLDKLLGTINGYAPNRHASKSSTENFQNNSQKITELSPGEISFKVPNRGNDNLILFCELLLMFGLRASELLRTTCSDILENGACIVHGTKRSRSRLIYHPGFQRFLEHRCSSGGCKIFTFSYSQLYRFAKTCWSNGRGVPRSKSFAPTHGFRYKLLRDAKKSHPNEQELLRDLIGHKSLHSQSYYLKDYSHG